MTKKFNVEFMLFYLSKKEEEEEEEKKKKKKLRIPFVFGMSEN